MALDDLAFQITRSAAALKAGGALRASTWGSKKGIVVDKHLVNATLELSQLLVGWR